MRGSWIKGRGVQGVETSRLSYLAFPIPGLSFLTSFLYQLLSGNLPLFIPLPPLLDYNCHLPPFSSFAPPTYPSHPQFSPIVNPVFALVWVAWHSPSMLYCNCYISSVTSVNLKKAGIASRNIVIKNNTRCFKSALQWSLDFSFLGGLWTF